MGFEVGFSVVFLTGCSMVFGGFSCVFWEELINGIALDS